MCVVSVLSADILLLRSTAVLNDWRNGRRTGQERFRGRRDVSPGEAHAALRSSVKLRLQARASYGLFGSKRSRDRLQRVAIPGAIYDVHAGAIEGNEREIHVPFQARKPTRICLTCRSICSSADGRMHFECFGDCNRWLRTEMHKMLGNRERSFVIWMVLDIRLLGSLKLNLSVQRLNILQNKCRTLLEESMILILWCSETVISCCEYWLTNYPQYITFISHQTIWSMYFESRWIQRFFLCRLMHKKYENTLRH